MDDMELESAESVAAASHPEAELDGAMRALLKEAPPYMQCFYQLLNRTHNTQAENTRTLNSLVSRVGSIEQNQQALSVISARYDTELAAVRAYIARFTNAKQEERERSTLEDPREILVRGTSLSVTHEPMQLASALLTALKLERHVPLVDRWRSWNPPARAAEGVEAVANVPAQVTLVEAVVNVPAPAVQRRALVFTLACPSARDDILRRTPGLKNLDSQAIFGVVGTAKLSVNALWPDAIHKLLKSATWLYKSLGHQRPIVNNLTVFMRPTKNGPLIPIYS